MLISIDAILYLDWLFSILWEIHASSQPEGRVHMLIIWDIHLSFPLKITQLQRRILRICVLTIVVWKKEFLKVLFNMKSMSECLCVCMSEVPPKIIRVQWKSPCVAFGRIQSLNKKMKMAAVSPLLWLLIHQYWIIELIVCKVAATNRLMYKYWLNS